MFESSNREASKILLILGLLFFVLTVWICFTPDFVEFGSVWYKGYFLIFNKELEQS